MKILAALAFCALLLRSQSASSQPCGALRTWDTAALAAWATPGAAVDVRPSHFSEAEYYRAPLDNYRTYPVYRPDREPPGYWDSLRAKKPEPLIPRRSARVTRFCSFKVTHTENTIWNKILPAGKIGNILIHAEGVRFGFPSSDRTTRKVFRWV